jgi:hypothetical protein
VNKENKAPVLTLEHLAPYLPYGLKVQINNKTVELFKACATSIETRPSVHGFTYCSFNDFKPILRPLSDLTKEIDHNGETFVPKNRIDQYTQVAGDGKLYLLVDGALWSCNPLSWDYYLVVKLISWRFDVFGLIEKGLAIDINSIIEKGDQRKWISYLDR